MHEFVTCIYPFRANFGDLKSYDVRARQCLWSLGRIGTAIATPTTEAIKQRPPHNSGGQYHLGDDHEKIVSLFHFVYVAGGNVHFCRSVFERGSVGILSEAGLSKRPRHLGES